MKIWLAMATLLAWGRDRVPLPWHGIVEYGYLASTRVSLVKAFRAAGMATDVRRGVLLVWFPDGSPIRTTFGAWVLASTRTQRWPWADLFPYEEPWAGGPH